MAAAPDLRRTQELFWRLLSAPEGVARGAADLRRAGLLESEDLDFLVARDERLSPVERLDIYADMYFYRLRDCLAEDFPRLVAWVGDAHFHNLVTDYLLAHPPSHFSLGELGRALPGFLDGHAPTGEFPLLADLARLEWARVDVFDDADAAPLSRRALLEGGASAPETFALRLVPSARLLRVDAAVLPLWKRLGAKGARGEAATSAPPGAVRDLCVWRKGFAVFQRELPDDEARCLRALETNGATLAEVGERLLAGQPAGAAPEEVARRFAALLERWARDEVLTRA